MELSITRALAKVKILRDRIEKLDLDSFSTIKVGKNTKSINGESIESFKSKSKGMIDSAIALFNNMQSLKEAIAKTNVETKVDFMGKEMSLYSLIEFKKSYELLMGVYNKAIQEVFDKQQVVDVKNEVLSGETNDLYSKKIESGNSVAKDFLTSLKEEREGLYLQEVVSGMSLEELVEKRDEIASAVKDADMILSEVNAKTMVTIDFDC